MARILVIDDDASARALLNTVLGYAGHQIHEARDGAEALRCLPRVSPDLIIVDLLMPTMDGLEFLRRARENPAVVRTPVVFYTASYLQSEAQHLAKACGVAHIITKPAEPEQIFKIVGEALGSKQSALPIPADAGAQDEFRARLTAALSQKAAQVVPRLEAMIALGLRLASERDPERLLSDFCDACRTIIGASIAVVSVEHNREPSRYFFVSQQRRAPGHDVRLPEPAMPPFAEVLSSRRAKRVCNPGGDAGAIGLPVEYSPVQSLLCAPVQSPQRVYGYVLLLNRLAASEFNEEDEALAHILAGQAGRIYENGSLYRDVKRYAEQLETEIAERRQAQEEVRTLNAALERRIAERTAQLEEANTELEAFGYTVSHDLRAPLRALGAYAAMMPQEEVNRLDDTGRRYLQTSIKSAARMSRMVDDLLAFSRLGRQELSIAPVDMQSLIRETWEEEAIQAGAATTKLELGTLPAAAGDRAMLREAWANLISNAIKYSSKNEQPIVAIDGRRDGDELEYSIRDNGVGFDPMHAGKLFRVFERLHAAKDFEGTGAGLAIVERIIRRHGGRVWAESTLGNGATFHFTLPISPD